jgi:hypothetical protein
MFVINEIGIYKTLNLTVMVEAQIGTQNFVIYSGGEMVPVWIN